MEDEPLDEKVENKEAPQNGESKIEKKYNAVMGKLVAIVNGANGLKPVKKIPNDALGDLVEQLFAEERKSLLEETKVGLKDLLRKYHELLKTIKQKKDELAKLETQKKEEFVKAATSLFDKIEDVGEIEKSYIEGLNAVTTS